MRLLSVRFTNDDYDLIQDQAERSGVSVEDFVNRSAAWHAANVKNAPKPIRMPPVMYED